MAYSWAKQEYPLILCPPMDGITDMAYRELVSEMGGCDAVYCEFVNVKGLIFENPKTLFELRFTDIQKPVIAQLFGNDPKDFYEASKLVVKLGFDAIDINMGCPAAKVAAKGGGCALMGDTENAQEIVRQTIKGANEAWKELGNDSEYEVTCKMRLGINDIETVQSHAMAMVDAGAKCVAIHGRTLKQMYSGEADWEPIKKFSNIINQKFSNGEYKPKVFGSGDVKSLYDAFVRLINTGCDGVMIGRGSFGNPWVFDKEKVTELKKLVNIFRAEGITDVSQIPEAKLNEIQQLLANKKPSFDELEEMALHHAALMVRDKGDNGILQMRKHLGYYFQGFDGAKELRNQLVRVNSIEEIKRILTEFKNYKPVSQVESNLVII